MDQSQDNPSHQQDIDRRLAGLAEKANQELEASGRLSANQAFTLGCTTGFIPAALVVLVVFMSTRSWQAVAISAAIMLVLLLAFSYLVAYVARGKTVKRSYESEVKPEIEQGLSELGATPEQFDRLARQILPQDAPLLKMR